MKNALPQTFALSQLQGLTSGGRNRQLPLRLDADHDLGIGPDARDVLARVAPAFKSSCPNDQLRSTRLTRRVRRLARERRLTCRPERRRPRRPTGVRDVALSSFRVAPRIPV